VLRLRLTVVDSVPEIVSPSDDSNFAPAAEHCHPDRGIFG
jgi:hypothetical protein